MAIDDGHDESTDSSPAETTDEGGDATAQADDRGGAGPDAEVTELDPETEHDNAREAHEAVLVEMAGDRDQPDPGGDLEPETSEPAEYPEDEKRREPTVGSGAELADQVSAANEQFDEVTVTLRGLPGEDAGETTAYVGVDPPDRPQQPPPANP